MESELRPRHCFLIKGERGYGFHLHGERNKGGQFIRKVEPGSSADLAGLRAGDRLVEVNGENVEQETHHQVVSRIRATESRTRLLVTDRDTDEYLQSRGLACTEDIAIEMGTLSPRSTPSVSPLPRENGSLSPKLQTPGSASPTLMDGEDEGSSVTSGSETHTELPEESSPEPEEPAAPLLPRLCHLPKRENGYGFNLHNDKTRGGQFVRSVDSGSAAESADIRPGDRLVEVNGVNINGLKHSEVVELIRAAREEVCLLLVDQETDQLFQRLGITPTNIHVNEVCVDEELVTESVPPTPSPVAELPDTDAPIVNIALTDGPITNVSQKSRTNGSLASQSSRSSTTQSEFSSSDVSIQVPDEDDNRVSDPYLESGLRLSPTAAEAKRKLHGNKKRAPPMDWCKKHEIFSNF